MGKKIILAGVGGVLAALVGYALWTAVTTPLPSPLPTLSAATTLPPATFEANEPPSTAPANTYTVAPGDTLFSIANHLNVPLDVLVAANGILNPDLIEAGQVLLIPVVETGIETAAAETAAQPAALAITATPLPPIDNLNGIPVESIVVLPDNVLQNARTIFAQGQALGNNTHAFSKVGDSTIQNPHFLARFDEPGGYNLAHYAYLQTTIDFFAGSFSREGAAVRKGFHAWAVFDPAWAEKTICQANETPIACELRLNRPSILLIRLGSNDRGVPELFEQNLRRLIELAIAQGVIPVLGTKADRAEGSNVNNEILRQLATEYQIPLWDFDAAAEIIPGRGLDQDAVHLTTFFAYDYALPEALQRGHGVHNLTALMMLDALRRQVLYESDP